MPPYFLSCDWGTTSFRLRLVRIPDLTVVAEEKSAIGTGEMARRWGAAGKGETGRLAFYQTPLRDAIQTLEQATGIPVRHLPLVLSGMASSRIGLMELPYKNIPFATDGSDAVVHSIAPTASFSNPLVLISGMCTATDVLRGEETLLVGCSHDGEMNDGVYIFPGTHSKHITVERGHAVDFNTYMTGEFFALLSEKSILSHSVQKGTASDSWFEKGVAAGASGNLLQRAFAVRVASLFASASPEENYRYLSGLLIGTELQALLDTAPSLICLVADQNLQTPYRQALRHLGLDKNLIGMDADAALIAGQWRIYKAFKRGTVN